MSAKRINKNHILNNALAHQEVPATPPLKTQKNILGIDWGEKFCGFAYSPDGQVVLALEVCGTQDFEKKLADIIEEKNITKLVWGIPNGMTDNLVVKKVKKLAKKQELSSFLIDERGSSQLCFTSQKNERIDDLAAAQILKFYLEKN